MSQLSQVFRLKRAVKRAVEIVSGYGYVVVSHPVNARIHVVGFKRSEIITIRVTLDSFCESDDIRARIPAPDDLMVRREIWVNQLLGDEFERYARNADSWEYYGCAGINIKPKAKKAKLKATQVYFFLDPRANAVKIGKSRDYKKRFVDIQVANPSRLEVIGVIKDVSADVLESAIHRQFSCHRLQGEWFAYSDEIKEYIGDSNSSEVK